ncbi:MAG: YdiU family protein, partial [Deltaproteobacteria bacterium]|nr:YdiU family protein [Deltaproteobacteria bacterium]
MTPLRSRVSRHRLSRHGLSRHRGRPWLVAWLAFLLLAGLPLAGRADNPLAHLAKGSSFGADLKPETRKKVIVEVPLVAEKGAHVLLANNRELKRLGLKPPENGLQSATYEKQVLGAFAFRPATPEEIQTKAYTHVGLATRYADKNGAKGVKGDGRAVLVGDVVVKNRKGRITGVYDIQVKGIGTGLHPDWKGFGHRHGRESLRQALEDALFSDYLATNGIRTNNWLAVIDTGKTIEYPDGGKERAGLLVRGGNFLRLAHLNLVKDDPAALRDLVDHVNRTLSMELGRKRSLSLAGLYKVLTQRKAQEVADLFFLRTVHGSSTYDNIGLVENMDHGTGSTVDRTHKNYSFFSKWVGFGGEPAFILSRYYETELLGFLKQVAHGAERKALDAIKPAALTSGMLEHRMRYQL